MNKLMQLSVTDAKKSFFNRMAVKRAVDLKKRKVLSKFGAYVRTRARSLMRPARQKSIGEMSQAEIITYEQRKRFAVENGRRPPTRPLASSKPGEPPRVILGMIKKFLFFVYDAKYGSVVIGPAKLNGRSSSAPETLEHGGRVTMPNGRTVSIAERPFMAPAFEAELPGIPTLWAGALAGN